MFNLNKNSIKHKRIEKLELLINKAIPYAVIASIRTVINACRVNLVESKVSCAPYSTHTLAKCVPYKLKRNYSRFCDGNGREKKLPIRASRTNRPFLSYAHRW